MATPLDAAGEHHIADQMDRIGMLKSADDQAGVETLWDMKNDAGEDIGAFHKTLDDMVARMRKYGTEEQRRLMAKALYDFIYHPSRERRHIEDTGDDRVDSMLHQIEVMIIGGSMGAMGKGNFIDFLLKKIPAMITRLAEPVPNEETIGYEREMQRRTRDEDSVLSRAFRKTLDPKFLTPQIAQEMISQMQENLERSENPELVMEIDGWNEMLPVLLQYIENPSENREYREKAQSVFRRDDISGLSLPERDELKNFDFGAERGRKHVWDQHSPNDMELI